MRVIDLKIKMFACQKYAVGKLISFVSATVLQKSI